MYNTVKITPNFGIQAPVNGEINTKLASSEKEGCKPFLKWVGGKTQMISDLFKYKPLKFNNYIEPFIGGGAFFFALNHSSSIISDANEELIITYRQVQHNVEEIISILGTYRNDEEFFYRVRSINPSTISEVERAARLIFLNKTCFNGLYRVNKKGQFNVPYGKHSGSFLNKEVLLAASKYMANTQIIQSDYKNVIKDYAKPGDFIFLDPPYQPISKNADFKRYTKDFFYEKDQIELAGIFSDLVLKGCYVMLTNSDHHFIHDLYKDFKIVIVDTKRLISSNSKTRTGKDIIVLGGI